MINLTQKCETRNIIELFTLLSQNFCISSSLCYSLNSWNSNGGASEKKWDISANGECIKL